jgi:hypothetical protein
MVDRAVATPEAIVRRARDLEPADRRRLGRWTSAALRDPRRARRLEMARQSALAALDNEPERKRDWERTSRPLFERLSASISEERRWRIVMLVAHLAAIVAIVSIPNGFPPPAALALTIAAPISAWAAWGRGTAWLGAIHAALAASVADRLESEDTAELRRPWAGAIESDPPLPPPRLGAFGALAPSGVLVVAWLVVTLATVSR